jgi:hypothetical protein
MTALHSILRALGRGRTADAPGYDADLSPKDRQDALKLIARAQRHLGLLERQLECGLLIRQESASAPERLDRLAATLDAEQAVSHVREAVAAATVRMRPVPHVVMADVLPASVLAAARDAIPAPVLFDAVQDGCEAVAVPFPLAPVVSMAVWAFVANLVKGALLDALLDAFRESLGHPPTPMPAPRRRRDFTVLHARLVRWRGGARRETEPHPLPGLVAIVNVGDCSHRVEWRSGSGGASEIVLPPGSAVAYVAVAGEAVSASGLAGEGAGGCTYEVVIGPHRAAQQALTTSAG